MRYFIWFLILLMACSKNKVAVNKVIYDLTKSRNSIPGDGNSRVTITVKLNKDSDPTKRNIIFKTSTGNFIGGTGGQLSIKADWDHDTLKAQAVLIAPSSPGTIYLSVWPDVDRRENYTLYDSILATPSIATSLKLNTSGFGLKSNFQSEDTLVAVVSNALGSSVSVGTEVRYLDSLVTGQTSVGQFRMVNNTTNAQSLVSAIYSVGNLPMSTKIFIKAIVWQQGSRTDIKDSILLTITQ